MPFYWAVESAGLASLSIVAIAASLAARKSRLRAPSLLAVICRIMPFLVHTTPPGTGGVEAGVLLPFPSLAYGS